MLVRLLLWIWMQVLYRWVCVTVHELSLEHSRIAYMQAYHAELLFYCCRKLVETDFMVLQRAVFTSWSKAVHPVSQPGYCNGMLPEAALNLLFYLYILLLLLHINSIQLLM